MLVSYVFILKIKVIAHAWAGLSMLQSLQQIVESPCHSLYAMGLRSHGGYLVLVPQHSNKARLPTFSRSLIPTGMCILGPYSCAQHIHDMWVKRSPSPRPSGFKFGQHWYLNSEHSISNTKNWPQLLSCSRGCHHACIVFHEDEDAHAPSESNQNYCGVWLNLYPHIDCGAGLRSCEE